MGGNRPKCPTGQNQGNGASKELKKKPLGDRDSFVTNHNARDLAFIMQSVF